MADIKISAMTSAILVTNEDAIPIVQAGANMQATRALLLTAASGEDINLVGAGSNGVGIVAADPTFSLLLDASGNVAGSVNSILITVPTSHCFIDIGSGCEAKWQFADASVFEINSVSSGVDFKMDATTGIISIHATNGVDITYVPGTPSSWNGTPPTTLAIGVDRCAALLKTLHGGVGP